MGNKCGLILVGFTLMLTAGCSEQPLTGINSIKANSGSAFGGVCPTKQNLAARVTKLNQETITTNSFHTVKKFDVNDFIDSSKIDTLSTNIVLEKNTQIILTLNRQCALKDPAQLPQRDLITQLNSSTNPEIMSEQSVVWHLPNEMSVSELEKITSASKCVLSTSLNKSLDLLSTTTTTPNDTYYNSLSHLKALGYEYLYNKIFNKIINTEDVITVAVIDTGNDLVHADMVGRNWENLSEKNGKPGVDDDNNGFVDDINGYNFATSSGNVVDEYGMPHGEHVAGLIAANVNNNVGVVGLGSARVKIMHLNVFGRPILPGYGGTDPLLLMENAIRYAADNGAKVINLSVGRLGSSTTALNALTYAVNKGVFIAASAGNNSIEITSSQPFFPAIYGAELNGMMAVGAADSVNGVFGEKCGFSNYSTHYVEITAPGCDSNASSTGLLSLGIFSEQPYVYMAGTSMSGPLVAAAAATVISYVKEKSGVEPSNILNEKILKMGGKKMSNQESFVKNGNALDMPSLLSYIDTEILGLPASCQ
ncbi:MAG: S8 family serine peptidase [Oligoflexia bacterium]|nr:S8 family serine peptidase [Oligoflexia bacterium]